METNRSVSELQNDLLEIIRQLTEQGEIEWYDDGNGGKDAILKITAFEYEDLDDKGEVVREKAPVVGLIFHSDGDQVRDPEAPTGVDEMAAIIWCNESRAAKNLHDLVQGIDR